MRPQKLLKILVKLEDLTGLVAYDNFPGLTIFLLNVTLEPGQWAPINFQGLYMEWTLLILALCMACTIILAFIGVNPDLIGLSPMIHHNHLSEEPRFIS